MKKILIFLLLLIGLNCGAQSLFVSGTRYPANSYVYDTLGLVWKSKVLLTKAISWPTQNQYWELMYVSSLQRNSKRVKLLEDSLKKTRIELSAVWNVLREITDQSKGILVSTKYCILEYTDSTVTIKCPPYVGIRDY